MRGTIDFLAERGMDCGFVTDRKKQGHGSEMIPIQALVSLDL